MVIADSRDDPDRFAVLFERHWPAIFRYCVARAGSDGEDIAAEVFRVGFTRRHDFDVSRTNALPWLYGIAAKTLQRHARSTGRRLRAVGRMQRWAEAQESEEPRVVERADAAAASGPAVAALDGPRAEDREIVLLHAWAELSYQEIADALGIPIGTVRSRLSRARRRLSADLGKHR
ncbi:MAG: RNA polymerase sigma factor [Acidimicrobiales bacterium]